MIATESVWYLRLSRTDERRWRVAAYENTDHPDGAIVDLPTRTAAEAEPPDGWLWCTQDSDRGILRVRLNPPGADRPPLWFVNVDEPAGQHPASNLVAFATDHFEPGTGVTKYTFANLGVNNDEQIGAVRWYRTGLIHQIFVAPAWRRRSVATALLLTASGFHQANGWPGKLHADGRRTNLGQHFAAGARYPQRVAPLTDTMPDMDAP